ncbi:energy transducer TonB [Hymenobacter taeanensis]|uniref:Energy transducer TonB n=1 Tax=Hymenobacter taeanensis TaxID=2735321 RepID=A0A6M6BG52_9BACT|nr:MULTISPECIES: energy transducer TonB [Hymenobacter]QJX46085.1 energy transducer TonB [Hymenobacter taeanensis]UOQ79939.1 energy transducer TonB [Hymenobacter sp. 5414T-23]
MTPTFRRVTLALALSAVASASAFAQQKLKYPKQPAAEIYDAVEKPAVPLGGLDAYAQYLADKQQYPTAALQAGTQGTVNVTFVIEKTGSISNVTVAQPVAPELDAEAIRLIKAGPRWTPAQHRGGVVRQRVSIPITFQIPASAEGGTAGAAPAAGAGPTTQVVTPDKPARPVGGTDAFFEWIQQNQKYPALARQRKVEGRVMMEFIVQKDGSLAEIKPIKRMGSGLDEEAIRLIKAAPKWEPATYKGQPMKQKMVLPVVFQL